MTAFSRNTGRLFFPAPALLAGALLVSIGAVAADYPATFESLDKDGNGYISSQEAAARPDLAKNWSAIDKNTDNQLDITEFSAFEGRATLTPPEDSEEPGIGAAPY
jgi:EF hand